jgi:hypothetical protein
MLLVFNCTDPRDPSQFKLCFWRENELLLNTFLWREMDCLILLWLKKQYFQRGLWFTVFIKWAYCVCDVHMILEAKEGGPCTVHLTYCSYWNLIGSSVVSLPWLCMMLSR